MPEEYIIEEIAGSNGLVTKLIKSLDGILLSRSVVDGNSRELDRIDYNASGQVTAQTVFVYDNESQPLETKAYDGAGDVVFIKKRGQAPIFYGKYQAGKPPFMCADKAH